MNSLAAPTKWFASRIFAVSLLALAGPFACSLDDVEEIFGPVPDAPADMPTDGAIAFQTFSDDAGERAASEARALIRTQKGYQDFFGHPAPANVDFTREWVIFYAAGTKPTGGYQASVLSLSRRTGTLFAVSRLESPGQSCAVTQAFTTPHVFIKFAAQWGSEPLFTKNNAIRSCDPTPNPCAAALCPVGSRCEVQDVVCVRAPCPPLAVCVPDTMARHCGGIAGIPCLTGQMCVDDPSDSCDPARGGADCGGICVGGSSPQCGGIAGIPCPTGQTCVDDPSDSCDPAKGGADCGGICVATPPAQTCGGFAGLACPGAGICIGDPSDSCDPRAGGADCGGLCQCVQNVLCTRDHVFDSSPKVCACVPAPTMCGPVCAIFCQYGNVLDAAGCPTCACKPAP